MKKPLVILTGPTAVGKTALSVELARKIGAEIISADSMQVYRGMDIGSAKITQEEMQDVRHYLIDDYDIFDDFSVNEFAAAAKKAIEEIYTRGKIPMIVGGTGFYIQAVLRDIVFTETDVDSDLRKTLWERAEKEGPEVLHAELAEIDPDAAAQIHANNVKRVIRALEYAIQTGEKISEHNKHEMEKESPYNFAYFVINRNRENLYNQIEKRVDEMMAAGLVDEVESLRKRGATTELVSMQGIGYKEILDYLNGETSLDEAVEKIKLGTRHLAKRQLTWFRRENDVIWLDADNNTKEELLAIIHKNLRDRQII